MAVTEPSLTQRLVFEAKSGAQSVETVILEDGRHCIATTNDDAHASPRLYEIDWAVHPRWITQPRTASSVSAWVLF